MKTAVEWLVQEANLLENNGWILPLVEKAKEMEKEQIMDAFYNGDISIWDNDGEQYYNETFKSE